MNQGGVRKVAVAGKSPALSLLFADGLRNQAIALKTPAKGLSDGGDPVRQHGLQGQVLAITV